MNADPLLEDLMDQLGKNFDKNNYTIRLLVLVFKYKYDLSFPQVNLLM